MNGLSNMPLSPARGYPATVLGVIPYAGVSFFTYDTLKHKYLGKWYYVRIQTSSRAKEFMD